MVAETRGLGLDQLGDLSALLTPPSNAPSVSGQPVRLDMGLIDEDPNQPRDETNPGFSKEKIAEIGATIKARGVKTPISVRENPDSPGRYLINDGARRYRGSKWAEQDTIPAFIDNDFVPDDQVVANIQREGHTPMELARLIQQRLAQGAKKGEIAKAWGKSPAYITQHAALLDMPAPIAAAFEGGRISDVTVAYDLMTAFKKSPDEVAAWLEDETQEITRGSVKLLREFLESTRNADTDESSGTGDEGQHELGDDRAGHRQDADDRGEDGRDEDGQDEGEQGGAASNPGKRDPEKFKKPIVVIEHDGRVGRIVMDRRPSSAGLAWLKYDDDGHEFEADLSTVKLIQLVEG